MIEVILLATVLAGNPFEMEEVTVAATEKTTEGKCGVGRCGANKPEKDKEDD